MVVLTPLSRLPRRSPDAAPASLPAPITGWNTRDSLDGMAPTDAVTLDNWYPGLGSVTVRGGTALFTTGLGGTIETLAEYYAGATRKMLGAANGKIFDCSSPGAVGAALKSGLSSNRWQTANFKAVQFWVNGSDTPQTFNGTSFSDSGWTGPSDVTALIGVYVFKNFVFLWEKNSQDFWYGAVNAITGAVTKFPLSMVTSKGGNLLAVSTLGFTDNSPDDLAAFIMTSGEVILYQGTDPGNASAWALVGRYFIGAPVGIRAVARYGGDTYITTLNDHTSLSSWFSAVRDGKPPAPSKVSGAVIEATAAGASLFGWQAIMYPGGGRMVFNIPGNDGTFDQHVLNTVTGAWCRYKDLRSACWAIYNNLLYFGGTDGTVYQAETGNADTSAYAFTTTSAWDTSPWDTTPWGPEITANAPINADGQQAWSQLKSSYRKRIPVFRPVIQSDGSVSYKAGIGYDYGSVAVGSAVSSAPVTSAWDTSPWDTTPWGPSLIVDTRWRAAGGTGQSVSTRVRAAGLQRISWLRTDFRIEKGINL